MKTFHINTGLRTCGRRLGLFLASLAVTSGMLLAQEPETKWVPEEKARIGVLLEERCEARPTAGAVCDRPPVVTSVVVDGPADAAGVQARDTLLSVNGLDVTRPEGRALLLGLESGVPVELELGRNAGRTVIRVTPELRPTEPFVDVRTMSLHPPGQLVDGPPDRVQVIRIPSVRARLEEVAIRLDSLRAHGDDFVFFHKDSDGTFKVRVSPGADLAEEGDLPRYVWENEELARRLVRVRDSSFHSAREHLDSLVRLRGHVQMLRADSLGVSVSVTSEADPGGEWAYYVTTRPVPGQLRTLLLSDLRVAGAEFRELSGGLAEYFDGAEEGLLVLRVLRDTPADRMGLMDGDVVVEVDGAKCRNIMELRKALANLDRGGTVEVKWIRKGATHEGSLEAH